MKFFHMKVGRWDEIACNLHILQIKDNKKPNPCWHQTLIVIIVVKNHGLGGGRKILAGEMKLYI